MAFTDKTLELASGVYSPRRFNYVTADAGAALQVEGYFNDAALKLNVGDRIYALAAGVAGFLTVISNVDGVVDCSNFVPVDVTDGD